MNAEDLIHRFLNGQATAEETVELSRRIVSDPDVLGRYLDLAELHAALMADESLREEQVVHQVLPPKRRWIAGLGQIAAGILLGVIGVGAVWAYAVQRAPVERELPVANGGFEQSSGDLAHHLPREFGVWGGDPAVVVEESGEIKPRSGRRMARMLASAVREDSRPLSRTAELWQVVPLLGSGDRTVRVRAWFNAVAPVSVSIMAAAGASGPELASDLWDARATDDPKLLSAGLVSLQVDADPHSWQMVELRFQVPDGARILVLDVAVHRIAGESREDGFVGQFVDDVSVSLISDEPVP